MTPDYQQWLHAELHLYRQLCKLTHLAFEKQGTCTTLQQMARLATDAMGLFDKTEEQQMPACLRGKCGVTCALCMEHAAYGDVCPRRGAGQQVMKPEERTAAGVRAQRRLYQT